jgi:hypothetical protein
MKLLIERFTGFRRRLSVKLPSQLQVQTQVPLQTDRRKDAPDVTDQADVLVDSAQDAPCISFTFPEDVSESILQDILQRACNGTSPGHLLDCILVCKRWARIGLPILNDRCRVHELPDEIILQILQHVRNSPPIGPLPSQARETWCTTTQWPPLSSLTNVSQCMRTCQKWHRIGKPLLFRHFSAGMAFHPLDRPGVSGYQYQCFHSFPTSLSLLPEVNSWVQSLTIKLHDHQSSTARIVLLAETLMEFPILKSLSIISHYELPTRYNPICRGQIAKIVKAIPPSVRSLEIDLQGRDVELYCANRDPLCDAIGCVLPQLTHVRLRLSSICPAILSSLPVTSPCGEKLHSVSKLESIVLCILAVGFTETRRCYRHETQTYAPAHAVLDEVKLKLESCVFPRLQSAVLSAPPASSKNLQTNGTQGTKFVVQSYDSHVGKWDCIPYSLGISLGSRLAYWKDWDVSFSRLDLSQGMKDGHDADVMMEGDAAWHQDATGPRFP